MNRSIQSRLVLTLTATAIVLSVATGILLHHFIRAEMERNFDRGLQSNGRALVSLVSFEAGGVLDFEFNEAVMPQYGPGLKAEYFQLWFDDGRAYARSTSLGDADLSNESPSLERKEFAYDLMLPNGRPGRAIRIAFVPESDQPQAARAQPMVAVIARDRSELDENLLHLLQSLIVAGSLLALTTALTSIWIVRGALRPLRRLAEQAATIDAANLSARLTQDRLPSELSPISGRLNDLLDRLETAFLRERRFSSDIAHELRTPIAELRSISEVALAWPDDREATQGVLEEALAIALQMQTLVNTLLSLARTHGGQPKVSLQPVQLASLVEETIGKLHAGSEGRFINSFIPTSVNVLAEPTLLRSILTNLFANAMEYAIGDEPVRCSAVECGRKLNLLIENTIDNLSANDLTRMFEPFWRKTDSRTNHAHAGLGLSLVHAYCGLMNVEVAATMPTSNVLRICLTLLIPMLPELPEALPPA